MPHMSHKNSRSRARTAAGFPPPFTLYPSQKSVGHVGHVGRPAKSLGNPRPTAENACGACGALRLAVLPGMRVPERAGAQGAKGCTVTASLAARQSSCAAIGKMEFLRIIDPVLYRPLTDGDCRERTTLSAHLCPSSPGEERGGREGDLIGFDGRNEAHSKGPRSSPLAASHSEASPRKWTAPTDPLRGQRPDGGRHQHGQSTK